MDHDQIATDLCKQMVEKMGDAMKSTTEKFAVIDMPTRIGMSHIIQSMLTMTTKFAAATLDITPEKYGKVCEEHFRHILRTLPQDIKDMQNNLRRKANVQS